MYQNEPTSGIHLIRTLQKFVVSAFVVCTFIAYAIHERIASPAAQNVLASPPAAPTTSPLLLDPAPTRPAPATASKPRPTAIPRATNTPAPTPTAIARGQYKDGAYTGPSVNAYWGWVQVKAVIQNGKLADVQLLNYPRDRRTSAQINNYAVPYLQQEAIQAQDAEVDVISGATLTSEAFMQSLQSALNTAKN